jgi:hypothetical protein
MPSEVLQTAHMGRVPESRGEALSACNIGFCNLRCPLDGAAQGGPPPLENFSCFISSFEAMALFALHDAL